MFPFSLSILYKVNDFFLEQILEVKNDFILRWRE